MKKNIIIWGTALILVIIAIFVTKDYNKKIKNSDESLKNTSTGIQDNNLSGKKANNFTLLDLNGKEVSLTDFKGKSVYLNFWATWCPPCRGEMPEIEKLYSKYKDKGLVVLAVDLGEPSETVKSFIKENNYSFRVLLDSSQSVAEKYNISAIPVSYFIDSEGNIAAKKVGAMTYEEMETNIGKIIK